MPSSLIHVTNFVLHSSSSSSDSEGSSHSGSVHAMTLPSSEKMGTRPGGTSETPFGGDTERFREAGLAVDGGGLVVAAAAAAAAAAAVVVMAVVAASRCFGALWVVCGRDVLDLVVVVVVVAPAVVVEVVAGSSGTLSAPPILLVRRRTCFTFAILNGCRGGPERARAGVGARQRWRWR